MIQKYHFWIFTKTKTQIQKDMRTFMFIVALFTIVNTWKQATCPLTDEWIRNEQCIHTMEYYPAVEKNEILPFATIMVDLGGITLSEIRQGQTNTI